MPFLPPIPEKPQHGVGKFEANNAFGGLAGLRFSWETAIGWLLPRIGIRLGQVPVTGRGGGTLDPAATAALFASGTEAVLEQIGHGLTATQSGVADEHVTTAAALLGLADGIRIGAADTLQVKKHVNRRTAPQIITRYVKPNVKALLAPYAKRTAAAQAQAQAAQQHAAKLEQRVRKIERQVGRENAIAIPGIEGRLGEFDRWRTRIEGRLGKLGKAATIGGFLLLLAEALKKMGLNWIRCSNVKKVGKTVCGMDSKTLEGLLAGFIALFATFSLVEFAKYLQPVVGEIGGEVTHFWRAKVAGQTADRAIGATALTSK